jgi:hypothetical protein
MDLIKTIKENRPTTDWLKTVPKHLSENPGKISIPKEKRLPAAPTKARAAGVLSANLF